jgi:hypothetical protein
VALRASLFEIASPASKRERDRKQKQRETD